MKLYIFIEPRMGQAQTLRVSQPRQADRCSIRRLIAPGSAEFCFLTAMGDLLSAAAEPRRLQSCGDGSRFLYCFLSVAHAATASSATLQK